MTSGTGLNPGEQLHGRGITVWTEHEALFIRYAVLVHGSLDARRIPLAAITGIAWREPTASRAGALELSVLGEGGSPGSGDIQFRNCLMFDLAARQGFARLRDWLAAEARARILPGLPGKPDLGPRQSGVAWWRTSRSD